MAYTVIKSQFGFNGVTYRKGEKVELDPDLANFYIEQGVVVSSLDPKVPHEVDGQFAELQKKIAGMEKIIEGKDAEISRLAGEIALQKNVIAELDATKSRGRK